jgi:alpha-D-xyloside xylohydrolase
MVTRRKVLALAGAAPAFLAATRADAAPQLQTEPEQHEFVQAMSSFDKTNAGVVFHCTTSQGKSVDVTLTVCTPEILRIQMCPDAELKNVKGLIEIKEDWAPVVFSVTEEPEAVSIDTGSMRIEFQKNPWKYVIYDQQRQVVLQEHVKDVDTQGNFRGLPLGFTTAGGKFQRSNETFALPEDESFYGLGERFTKLNKVGLRVNGWLVNPWGSGTDDSHKTIPFVMSTGGYGIFANTTFRNRWDMGSRSVVSYTFLIDDPRLDFFILYGPSLKQVLARYEEVTGWPAFPPKESFGVWFTIGRRDHGDASPIALAKKFRDLDLPIDYFTSVVSIQAEGNTQQDELAYARQMSVELGKMGIKIGLRVDPFLRWESELSQEAKARGYAVVRKDGSIYEDILVNGPGHKNKLENSLDAIERGDEWRARFYAANRGPCLIPDFTNPAMVKWWKEKVRDFIKAGCFGIGMSDFGEDTPADGYYFNKRSGLEMHNLYTLLYHKATFEAVAEYSGHRGLVNARSGTAGMQRYPICWSGDPNCEWEEMASTLRGGLCIGLSGVPFWSNDTGGFNSVGHHLTEELYIRWLQMAMFQSHIRFNGSPLRAPWAFGDQAVENYRKYAKLRYRLLPYIYSHAYNATKTGVPLMRAMVLEFQDDPSTHHIQDQYMFGDALLVAPVSTQVNRRSVYLPAGTWYDYETGKEYTGPVTLHVEPPLNVLPLYVRDNAIIPMGPGMAYIGEKHFTPITLDVWLASEAEFTLYDDDERTHTEEIVKCSASRKGSRVMLNVGASGKTYIAKFNKTARPKRVILNGKDMPHLASQQALENAELGWYFDPSSVVYAKFGRSGNPNELVLHL